MSTTANPTIRQKARRQSVDPDRLAQGIMAAIAQTAAAGDTVFPSERTLAQQLGVSRHAVRNSISYLEAKGAVRRIPGRGSVMLTQATSGATIEPGAGPPLRCINFLQGPAHLDGSLQWLVQAYLAGYTEVLDLYDLKTRFLFWADDRDDFEAMFWPRASRREQALVLMNRRAPNLLEWLNHEKIAYVLQNHAAYNDDGLPPHSRVYVNKFGGMFDAVSQLIEMGHRRIGFAGAKPSPDALTPSYEAWESALKYHGLPARQSDVLEIHTEIVDLAMRPCVEYLGRTDRPTAVVTGQGAVLLAMREAAAERGLTVPDDVSLIGFTSHETDQYDDLSVIATPRRQLARSAVEVLMELVKRDDPAREPITRMLSCDVRMRQTTRAPT